MTVSLPAQPASALNLEPLSYANLPGWQQDDHAGALKTFTDACAELTTSAVGFRREARLSGNREDWIEVCSRARQTVASSGDARAFFEQNLVPVRVTGVKGQFTGYFEPELEGSRIPSRVFHVPVLARPDDLVRLPKSAAARLGVAYGRLSNGRAKRYFTRQQIEQGKLADRGLEILFLRSWPDLFFMQIQGSGRVRLRDGSRVRLAYAAKSGLPYTAIGKVLIDRNELTREEMSMQALRRWLKDNPTQARGVMWQNESYVFFRELQDHGTNSGPIGAQGLPLTALRSLAVDRRFWALGVPLWVSTTIYANGELQAFDRVMVAQDTGSAIKGPARGDVFMGSGHQAGKDAGAMDQRGTVTALLPHRLAVKLLGQLAK